MNVSGKSAHKKPIVSSLANCVLMFAKMVIKMKKTIDVASAEVVADAAQMTY